MLEIHGDIRHYPWGSRTKIAQILGRQPSGQPEAEYWLGTYPGGSARSCAGSLLQVIDRDPSLLGEASRARFGNRLPFMVKILAACRHLSIQVHPTAARAAASFSSHGCMIQGVMPYADPWAKPEFLVALEDFEALYGLREPSETAALLRGLDASLPEPCPPGSPPDPQRLALAELIGILEGSQGSEARLRAAFFWILAHCTQLVTPSFLGHLESLVTSNPQVYQLAQTLAAAGREFPGDAAAGTTALMNTVTLRRGQAIFVPAGRVHAYVSGVGVEVMGASDNVVRAGLTSKRVDLEEIAQVMDFSPTHPQVMEGVTVSGSNPDLRRFPALAPEFDVWWYSGSPGGRCPVPGSGFPRILLVVEGAGQLASQSQCLPVQSGSSYFLSAGEDVALIGHLEAIITSPHPD